MPCLMFVICSRWDPVNIPLKGHPARKGSCAKCLNYVLELSVSLRISDSHVALTHGDLITIDTLVT